MSAEIVERLRQFHREIVESDGAESGQMRLTREAADEIERLTARLAETEMLLVNVQGIAKHAAEPPAGSSGTGAAETK